MAIFNKEGMLVTKKGKNQVDELVGKLSFVSETYLVNFLQVIGLSIPRKLRMKVLTEVLKDSVKHTIEERKSLADEMGYRLTWFSKFTDTQLVNLLEWYKSPSLGNHYLVGFWKDLLNFMVLKGVGDSDLERLFKEAEAAEKAGKRPTTKSFNKALDAVLYDEAGEIDGVTQEQFRPVTYKATTLTELRLIGDKFHAPIPKRLKKSEMLQVILDKLKEREALTPELEKKLKTQNIILLERFAKDHDIKVSTELKKEEIIEFILSNAEETKSSYFVPQSQEVYENLDEPVVKKVEPKPEPKPEIKPEPKPIVIEKVVDTTPNVIVNAEQIDYRPQLDKLAEAFNKLAMSFEQKEFSIKVENNHVMPEPVVQAEKPQQIQQVEQVTPRPQADKPQNMMVGQEMLIQELLKEDDSDAPELDPHTDLNLDGDTPKTIFRYKKRLGVLAACFALIFAAAFAWVALLALGYLIAPFLIEANQMYADLDELTQMIVTYGSIAFAVINLYACLRLLMNPKKKELIVIGSLTTLTGVLITGLLVFGSIGKEVKKTEKSETNETVRLAEAIEKINKPEKDKRVKKSGGFIKFIVALLLIVLLAFVALYAIWRLDFTYGYENIPFIGEILRDSIIEPLFGSAHNLSA